MFDDFVGAGAEATPCTQGTGEGADYHVDVAGVNFLVFGDAAAGATEDAKGPSFVEDEAEFVAEFQFNL